MGRNKKRGERYPSGKLKPTGDPIQPALWQRVRIDVAKLAGDARLSSQVGRYSFHRELTDTQVAAAFRVGTIYGLYERDHGKRRSIASPSYQRGMGGGAEFEDRVLIADDKAFKDLQLEISALAMIVEWPEESGSRWTRNRPTDNRLRDLIESLCVDDRAIDQRYLDLVRAALDDLAVFFEISKSRKRSGGRKRPAKIHQLVPTPAAPSPLVAKSMPTDKAAYLVLVEHMRPDLDAAGREKSWEMFMGLKDREQFNRSKGKPR